MNDDARLSSQKDHILWHLKTYGSITPVEALREYGCFRLAARINELKEEYDINSVMISQVNQLGKKVSFSRYSLAGGGGHE
jgi:DNA-directed RNA polymerase alpha subunit